MSSIRPGLLSILLTAAYACVLAYSLFQDWSILHGRVGTRLDIKSKEWQQVDLVATRAGRYKASIWLRHQVPAEDALCSLFGLSVNSHLCPGKCLVPEIEAHLVRGGKEVPEVIYDDFRMPAISNGIHQCLAYADLASGDRFAARVKLKGNWSALENSKPEFGIQFWDPEVPELANRILNNGWRWGILVLAVWISEIFFRRRGLKR